MVPTVSPANAEIRRAWVDNIKYKQSGAAAETAVLLSSQCTGDLR